MSDIASRTVSVLEVGDACGALRVVSAQRLVLFAQRCILSTQLSKRCAKLLNGEPQLGSDRGWCVEAIVSAARSSRTIRNHTLRKWRDDWRTPLETAFDQGVRGL
jgi:hypothetical protein